MSERVAPAPPEGFVRIRMGVAYDGTAFHGFAANDGVRTVQGELEAALATVLRHPVSITCAGRTDAGVHARGQVVSFDADAERLDPATLGRAVDRMVADDLAVTGVAAVGDDFDARFSCTGRTYRYHVLDRPIRDPLLRHLTWHVRDRLDVAAMRQACDQVIGRHDFTSFSKRNRSRPDESFVRHVRDATWSRRGDVVRFEITANAFTHQMVRSLVGAMVEVGRGRRRAVDMGAMIRAADRSAVPSPAPPRGLVLWRAHYD